ncbi:MAG: DUF2127 domain-containing protein [Nitrospiraceae bacterium]|nr:DUF2127 domain-containing protein [Nitrospiraceae bacterium]
MDEKRRNLVHKGFEIGILLKFIDGIFEVTGGMALVWLSPQTLKGFVRAITRHELSEDPRDLVANFLVRSAGHFSVSAKVFVSVYLLSHGIIKIALVLSLWRRKLWSYPAAIVFFILFIIYQVYRYTYHHSAWLVLLSILDVIVVMLTWMEYGNLRRQAHYEGGIGGQKG